MTETEQSLLRAVLETPDDDLPRLVMADWFDEHGDPERAEYIRASINFAKEYIDPPKEYLPGMMMSARQFAVSKNQGHIPFDSKWHSDIGGMRGWAVHPSLPFTSEPEKYSQYMVSRDKLKEWFPLCFADPKIQWTLKRGWPYKLECDTARFIGGSCSACSGTGRYMPMQRWFINTFNRGEAGSIDQTEPCKDCLESGYYPNLHDVVGSNFPITEIHLVDKKTNQAVDYKGREFFIWYRDDHEDAPPSNYALNMFLPKVIFKHLKWTDCRSGMYSFDTVDDADKRLSAACVRLIRSWAKLKTR